MEDTGAMFKEYLTEMTKIVIANKGIIDKYLGDSINLRARLEGLTRNMRVRTKLLSLNLPLLIFQIWLMLPMFVRRW